MTSIMAPFGTSAAVLTATTSRSPPMVLTVLVTMRLGAVSSFLAYSAPLGQLFPVTFTTSSPFISTCKLHPIGHLMQVSSFIMVVPPIRLFDGDAQAVLAAFGDACFF